MLTIFIICAFLTATLYKRKKKYKKEYKGTKENRNIIGINNRKRKKENNLLFISFSGIVISVIGSLFTLFTSVPIPEIYPLDNEARIYNGIAEVTIDAVNLPFFHTYYTLDGNDPKNGKIYENTLTISKTTTVSAKNKFFFWWSGLSQRTYRFENVPIAYSNGNSAVSFIDNELVSIIVGFAIVFILLKTCVTKLVSL